MVKSMNHKSEPTSPDHHRGSGEASSSSSCKYKGARKRKWGKFVSEIRIPNSRERIWLGSYESAEKAARAFDAALFCLRGKNAKFNFPDNLPEITNGRNMSPNEIQAVAARFAHSTPLPAVNHSSYARSDSPSSTHHAESPCPSVSDGAAAHLDYEIPLDSAFLDQFLSMGNDFNVPDSGAIMGFDDFSGDFYMQPSPVADYWLDSTEELSSSQSFSLWNF